MSQQKPKLAVLGFGLMGTSIAHNLVKSGNYAVSGWNRNTDKVKEAKLEGLSVASSVEEAIKGAEFVVSCLSNDQAVKDVYHQAIPAAEKGQIFIDMSTIYPQVSRDLYKQLQNKGAHMLDAPIVGSPVSIKNNKASIYVGGDKEIYEKSIDLIKLVGPTVTFFGQIGNGLVMKLATNLSLVAQVSAFAEGVLLATHNGIDKKAAIDAMLKSAIASPALQYRAPYINELPEQPLFTSDMAAKDVSLIFHLAQTTQLSLPTLAAAEQLIQGARANHYNKDDFAALYYALAALNGETNLPTPLSKKKGQKK